MKAIAKYKPVKWDEKSVEFISADSKMSKASVSYAFDGQIQGRATVEYLMFYKHFDEEDQHNSEANYVGLMRVDGKLNGKSGSFVMEDHGTFRGGLAQSELTIVPGSGTGELEGIVGTAHYHSTKDGSTCEIDYQLH